MSDYSHPTNHILHTLLTKLSTGILGVGPVALRLPAFLAALLSMPVFYLFARGMFNRYIALIALADRPTVFVEYTSDVARLNEGIGRLFAMSQSGMTLLDGIVETSRGL